MKLSTSLTAHEHTISSSRLMSIIKTKTIKILAESTGEILADTEVGNGFLTRFPKHER